jgi:1-acyl-sn-glycerol-3-phosphate acyltransferase
MNRAVASARVSATLPIFLLAWAMLAIAARWILDNPRRVPGQPINEDVIAAGLAYRAMQVLCATLHRLRVEGRERLNLGRFPGPLIVVANHTAGVDPLLIQSVCPFEVRWMMARDMMSPGLQGLWDMGQMIPVDRQGRDTTSVRIALRHLANGGVIGVFPEGGIERPARTLKPFLAGVGLIIAKSHAPVLPIIIEGTPEDVSAAASLLRPSKSRVRILETIRYRRDMSAHDITRDLEERFARETGWTTSST